jgi:hypothetical protein
METIYLITTGNKSNYFITEPVRNFPNYFITEGLRSNYFITESSINSRFIVTSGVGSRYIISEDKKLNSRYLVTTADITRYFTTELRDIDTYPNVCYYPKELDIIRQKATLLIWDAIKKKLYSSLNYESWGKINTRGYFSAGNVRLLLDYLSSIWLERDNDSRSGLVRTSDYYYTKYKINDIIVNFRNCDINIKPIVALFNLNSYSVIDGNWPNYFIINNIINPPTEEALKTLKQYTDIFTLDGDVTANSGQSKYNISNNQMNFPLTKTLKYITSFVINGSDYIGYVDYNYTTVTYSPSVLNGYVITSSDTVTITYWYED